jgi:hypothetical protein
MLSRQWGGDGRDALWAFPGSDPREEQPPPPAPTTPPKPIGTRARGPLASSVARRSRHVVGSALPAWAFWTLQVLLLDRPDTERAARVHAGARLL